MAAMAVRKESLHHATDGLILPNSRKYYPSYIHAHHWQLRSLIHCQSSNLIYYPSGSDIYQLDAKSCERELVTALPFYPRCISVANGWICCGADLGEYAVIKLDETTGHIPGLPIGPDTRLDLDPMRRYYSTMADTVEQSSIGLAGPRQSVVPPEVKITKVGTEIVNCITLWFPPAHNLEEAYDFPVSVLSNNDHTVSVVNLQESEVLDTLNLEDCINRATMSPDGRTLIAIGDDPYMHVFQRVRRPAASSDAFVVKESYGWQRCESIQLHKLYRMKLDCEHKGSFSAAFSPSGRYLAIGTQFGRVLIYDAQNLTNPDVDPHLLSFTTSRPDNKDGAVRAMEFSPEPLDLLAWTEDNGKFGVADIRRNFLSRQTVVVDESSPDIERLTVIERPGDLSIDPRLRSFRTGLENGRSAAILAELERRHRASAAEDEMERQQLQLLSQETQERLHAPLSRDETQVLEVLQLHRRHRERESQREAAREAANPGSNTSNTINWTDTADDLRRNAATERRSASNAMPASQREYSSNRGNESLRAYITERNQERERRGQQPRRRGSVILAAAQNALDRDTHSERNSAQEISTANNRSSQHPPRLPPIGSDSSSNPWAELEALYRITIDPPVDPTARMRIEIEPERREYTRRLQQNFQPSDERARIRLASQFRSNPADTAFLGPNHNRIDPHLTTGCAWSQDGKTLYIGAENGVYEYKVNVNGRRFFPDMKMF